MADLCLTDSVYAAEALFDSVRIPRQVIVDHEVRTLKVNLFACSVGSDEHLDLGLCWKDSWAFILSSRPRPP
jgi:hypothetical protein